MPKSSLLDRVESCIREHAMLQARQELWIGLSGGADSIALAEILLDLGYQVRAAHCNFHLRGDESDADEAFVRAYCKQKQIELSLIDFDTYKYAAEQSVSIEMAARRLRYDYFEQLMQRSGIKRLAVAHHADDNAETILLNLAAGTGIRGLSGMPYLRHDGIIRPLLDIPQADLLAYLAGKGQGYCVDSSNADEQFKRNFVRHQLLPRFAQLNPSFLDAFARTMQNLRGVEAIYMQEVQRLREQLAQEGRLSIDTLRAYASPFTILYDLLQPLGFSRAQIEQIAESIERQPGARFFSTQGYRLYRSFDALELDRGVGNDAELPLQIELHDAGELLLPDGSKIAWQIEPLAADTKLRIPPHEALVDLAKLQGKQLVLRRPQTGDRIYPYGMQGSKLLSKSFVDKRLTLSEREQIFLLTADAELVWALGLQADRRYRIERDSKTVVRFMFYNMNSL